MKQQYVMRPETVEVHSLGNKTDVILRKDIEEAKIYDGSLEGDGDYYIVYRCEEKQFRYPGILTKEEVEATIDTWWNYEEPTKAPKVTVEECLAIIQAAQEAQDDVLAEILLNTLTAE